MEHKLLNTIKSVRAKRMNMVKTKINGDNSYDVTEAVTVKQTMHPWGKMMVVHHGASHSFPLHPEHQEAIAKLKDGESTSFTDETKSKVTAHRIGNSVLLSHRGSNTKTPVAMSHFHEEVETNEGIIKGTASLVKHAVGVPMKAAGRAAMGTVNAVHSVASGIKNTVKDVKDASKKVKAAYAEEIEQIDEISKMTLGSYIKGASMDMRNTALKHGSIKKMQNRMKGIEKATDKLTKEDLDLSEVLKASDPVGKWIDDFVHSDNPKFKDKTKEERRKMALGAYYAAQKEAYEYSTEELAEGRGRPPKEGSKAWHAAQAKASSGEASDQEADKNIVNQMRKKPVGDTHHLVFGNGEKKDVHVKHVNKALSMLANTPKPADREKLQSSLGHSHKRFMDTVTSGKAVEDSARPKVSLGKMKAEAVETADFGPEKAYIENGKVVVKRKARKDLNIENLDLEIENSLNNLYLNLSESNQELFLDLISTDEGLVDLINFAKDQGF